MSKLIIVACGMHKIAEFPINVKYRRPGNVVAYLPVEFEVFIDGEYYKAIPLQSTEIRMLANVPKELVFQIKNGNICNYKPETEEIVQAIAAQLAKMNVDEIPGKHCAQAVNNTASSPLLFS